MKLNVILPETAVQWAWGLTAKYSEKLEGQVDAEYTQQRMKDVQSRVEQRLEDSDSEVKIKAQHDIRYLDNLYSVIDSSVRSLVISINGRNHNFAEVGDLIKKQEQIIDNTKRLTANLQSITPRIASTTIGGVTVPMIIKALYEWKLPGYTLPIEFFYFTILLASAAFYLFHEWKIVPRSIKKHQQLLIQAEYARNKYYDDWLKRAQLLLSSLLHESTRIYRKFYDKSYQENKEIVTRIIEGIEQKYMCRYVHVCMETTIEPTKNDRINYRRWPTCETSIGVKECPVYKKLSTEG